MAGGPLKPIKKQLKRLKTNQYLVSTRIMGCILVRAWLIIIMMRNVEAQRTASRIDDRVQILQPPHSVICQEVGTLYPALNFGHVRITANLSELQETAHRVCNTAMLFKGLTNYTEPGILRNISPQAANAFVAAERGKYPTKPFTSYMKAMVNTMESKCHDGEAGMGLVQQIFRSVPIASSTRNAIYDHHAKRQTFGAISLLFSAYNFYETQQLSSKVDSLKQNQRHIITSIKTLADATQTMQGNFEKLVNETRKIETSNTLRSLENQILDATQMVVIRVNEFVSHINTMSQGLYTAPGGKLSPLLVDPGSLQISLANMTNIAQAKGYNAISTVLPHIFELESSLYVHEGRQIVDIIVHVPLVTLSSRNILYKRTEIPFILPFSIDKVDLELQQQDQEHAVWSIKQTGNYGTTNKASSSSYELPKEALDECTKINDNWYCRHLIRRMDNIQNSCEVALYHSQMTNIHLLCEVELLTIPEAAISIANRRTLIYSKEQIIDIECDYGNGSRSGPNQYVISGINEIVLPRNYDCTVSTLRHEWRADAFLEIEATPRVLPVPLDLRNILGAAIVDFEKRVKYLKLNPFKPVCDCESNTLP